jgi:hypothetical protein
VNDAFARDFVDQRNRLLQRVLGGSQIIAVDGRSNLPQRRS